MVKKIFCIIFCAFILTALSSCSTPSNDTSLDVQKIIDNGVLKVGVKVDVPNFGYKNPKTNEYEGLEIDIAKALAKEILGDSSKVEFQGVTPKTRGPLLDNDEIDLVIATFTITDARKKQYNFSESYYTDGVGLMVMKDSGIKSISNMDGKTVAVAQSSTSRKVIQEAADKAGVKINFMEFGTYTEIKAALTDKRVDAFAVDAAILSGYLDDSTIILDERFSSQDYGVAAKKTNTGLAKVVEDTIIRMKADGELDALLKKWNLK